MKWPKSETCCGRYLKPKVRNCKKEVGNRNKSHNEVKDRKDREKYLDLVIGNHCFKG